MKRIIAIVDDIYEDLELWYPKIRLEEEGWTVVIAGPEAGRTYTGKHGYPCRSEISFAEMKAGDYDGLLVPGGFAPDKMRRDQRVLSLVREMHAAGRLVAFICHAGWVLISAGILRGRRATSTVGIRDDMTNAGVDWLDHPVVVDGNLVTSRAAGTAGEFAAAIVARLVGESQASALAKKILLER